MFATIIIDLKLDKNRQPKICEFGQAYNSAFEGYKRITGKELFWDVVVPQLEQRGYKIWHNDCRHVGGDKRFRRNKKYVSDHGVHAGKFSTYFNYARFKNVLYFSKYYELDAFKQVKQHRPELSLADHSLPLFMLCENKAYMHFLAGDVLQDVLPAQKVYLKEYEEGMAQRLIADLGDHDAYVLKPPAWAKGQGIEVCRKDDLESTLQRRLAGRSDGWRTKCDYPFFVAQACVSGPRVKYGGNEREATMRIALTAIVENGEVKLVFHDAYYKLTASPYSPRGLLNDRFMSSSHFAAEVDQETKQHVFNRLKPSLEAMFLKLDKMDMRKQIRTLLQSNDLSEQAGGLMMLADSRYECWPEWQTLLTKRTLEVLKESGVRQQIQTPVLNNYYSQYLGYRSCGRQVMGKVLKPL